jgi:hypothetical protein
VSKNALIELLYRSVSLTDVSMWQARESVWLAEAGIKGLKQFLMV